LGTARAKAARQVVTLRLNSTTLGRAALTLKAPNVTVDVADPASTVFTTNLPVSASHLKEATDFLADIKPRLQRGWILSVYCAPLSIPAAWSG